MAIRSDASQRSCIFSRSPELDISQRQLLRPLQGILRPFKRSDLLTQSAALQLEPDNAQMLAKLEGIATASLGLRENGQPLTYEELAAVLQHPVLQQAPLSKIDDPHEYFFAQSFTWPGGPYTVLPGPVTAGLSPLVRLSDALRYAEGRLPNVFVEEAKLLLQATLRLSNEMTRRAGLRRLTIPGGGHWNSEHPTELAIPDPETLHRLCAAVRYPLVDLEELLGSPELLALQRHLTQPSTVPDLRKFTALEGPLHFKPLVMAEECLIVAAPHALIPATVTALLALARRAQQEEAFSSMVHELNAIRVAFALHRLGLNPRSLTEAVPVPGASHGLYALDIDKALYVLTVTEPIGSRMNSKQHGWQLQLPDLACFQPPIEFREVLYLVILAEHGHAFRVEVPRRKAQPPDFLFRIDDLETFASAHQSDPLALWRLARSMRGLREQATPLWQNPGDEMAFHSDRRFLTALDVMPESLVHLGAEQRSEWWRRVHGRDDRHGVPWIDGEQMILVERARETAPALYLPVLNPWPAVVIHIDAPGSTLWVMDVAGPEPEPAETTSSFIGLSEALTYAAALWLAELSPHLPAVQERVVVITLSVTSEASETSFNVRREPEHKRAILDLQVGGQLIELLKAPGNDGERLLTAALYKMFWVLTSAVQAEEEQVWAVVDQVAPPGDKRHLLQLALHQDSELDPGGLDLLQRLEPSELQLQQIRVGRALAEQNRWAPGEIDGLNTQVIIEATGMLFSWLEAQMNRFDHQALLHLAFRQYEALRHDTASLAYTFIVRQAALGVYARRADEFQATAAVAWRFLIELLAARPSPGQESPSHAALGELLAAAASIVQYGIAGDALRYSLGAVTAVYGLDGSFRVAAPEYMEAQQVFSVYALSRSAEEANTWRHLVAERSDEEPSDHEDERLDWMNAACQHLYGFSLRELGLFFNQALNLGDSLPGAVKQLPIETFLSTLQETEPWSREVVETLLKTLCLQPREHFLKPPAPFKPSEVYPWQFNRELSLVRRPFLIVPTSQGDEVMWGNRALEAAKKHWLFTLFGETRLQAPEGKAHRSGQQFLQKLREHRSSAFNRDVADSLRAWGLPVWENVKHFGRLKLAVDGDPLGDIDVLLLEPEGQRLFLVECKSYLVARTPSELASDLEEMLDGKRQKGGGRARPLMMRHERRAEFVRHHLQQVLHVLGVSTAPGWTVHPVYVMSHPPLSLLAVRAPFPMYSLEQFLTIVCPREQPSQPKGSE